MKTNDSCMENEHLVSLNREYFNTIQYDFISHKNIVFKKKKTSITILSPLQFIKLKNKENQNENIHERLFLILKFEINSFRFVFHLLTSNERERERKKEKKNNRDWMVRLIFLLYSRCVDGKRSQGRVKNNVDIKHASCAGWNESTWLAGLSSLAI